MRRKRLHACLVCALLGSHAGLVAWGAYRHSPSGDEVAHLPAGLSHLELGRFGHSGFPTRSTGLTGRTDSCYSLYR